MDLFDLLWWKNFLYEFSFDHVLIQVTVDGEARKLTATEVQDVFEEVIDLRAELHKLREEDAPDGFYAEFDSNGKFKGYRRIWER
jgi:hypothetical protein